MPRAVVDSGAKVAIVEPGPDLRVSGGGKPLTTTGHF